MLVDYQSLLLVKLKVRSIVGVWSKLDQDTGCCCINVFHDPNLFSPFIEVILIDAYRIDPKGLMPMEAHVSKSSFQISCHHELFSADQDG